MYLKNKGLSMWNLRTKMSRFLQLRFWVGAVAPGILLATTVYWVMAVTVPFYALHVNQLPDRVVFGDHADPRYYYQNMLGMALANVTLLVWAFFVIRIPAVIVLVASAVGCIIRRRGWAVIATVSGMALFLHINVGIGLPRDDVFWACEVIFRM